MDDEMILRSALHGFNRRDVLACIEQLTNAHKAQVQSLEGQLRQLREENNQLKAQLEETRAKAESSCGDTLELEAYRRAERTEREARERADRVTQEAESALMDMHRVVEKSTERLNAAMAAWVDAAEVTREELLAAAGTLPQEV